MQDFINKQKKTFQLKQQNLVSINKHFKSLEDNLENKRK